MPDRSGIIHSCQYMQMICIVSGQALYEFENAEHKATKGDIIFINAEVPYRYTSVDDDTPLTYYDMTVNNGILSRDTNISYPHRLLSGSFAFYMLRDTENKPHTFFNFSKTENSIYSELFNKAYLEYKEAKSGHRDALLAYFTLIIINATRQNELLGNGDDKVYRNQAITFVKEYIDRCYCDTNICASGLADLVYLNVDYLGRIFKKATGHNITAAIQKKRIEQICRLLATTDRPINEIARESGFLDMHFFYKVFKKHMGTLPGEYRENSKK